MENNSVPQSTIPLIIDNNLFIYNITQLLDAINQMDEQAFKKNVSSNGEVVRWFNYVLDNEELSKKLMGKTSKEEYMTILKEYLPNQTDTTTKKQEKIDNESIIMSEKRQNVIDKIKSYFSEKNQMKEDEIQISEEKENETNFDIKEPIFIKTGIEGFDDLINSGIPQGSSVLLCGGPGTGKTTFSLQILANSAAKKEKCLYLSFEEEPSQLRAHMRDYGWDSVKMEKEGFLKIRKMNPFSISRSVEALLAHASGELKIDIDPLIEVMPDNYVPDKIVLDSLSAVAAAFVGREDGYRVYIEQLFTIFKKIGATSFLISEVEENTNRYTRTGVEEFLADAVVVFYNFRQKSVRVQAIEIIKIRGVAHQKKIVPFKMMTGKGIVVFPKEDAFAD